MRITAQTDTHQVKSITLNPNTLKGGNVGTTTMLVVWLL
jgi:hypothetical protein